MEWKREDAQKWQTPILSDQRVLKALKQAAQDAQAAAWTLSKSDRAFLKVLRIAADA